MTDSAPQTDPRFCENCAAPSSSSVPYRSPSQKSVNRPAPFRAVAASIRTSVRESFAVRRLVRLLGVLAIDGVAIAASLALAMAIANIQIFTDTSAEILLLATFAGIVVLCLFLSGIYRKSWRYVSYTHCIHLAVSIIIGSSVAWLAAMSVAAVRYQSAQLLPVAVNYWAFATVSLGAVRMARRGMRELGWSVRKARTLPVECGNVRRALLVGPPRWARSSIDLSRSESASAIEVVGVLLSRSDATIQRLNRVAVLGSADNLKHAVGKLQQGGKCPDCIVVCDDGVYLSHGVVSRLVHYAREIGLEVFKVSEPWRQLLERKPGPASEHLPVEDLLGRTEFDLDRSFVARQISGRCILVTGAGGTIGSELCRQLASFGPSRLVLLDHSEYNIYAIEMQLREQFPKLDIRVEICSVSQQSAVRNVFRTHRPVFVYHAAALKHVPIVEQNPCAGVLTNVIGTRILADAVCEFSARAMIQVSTDKAVNPVGMMGATKRVGELYSQALDLCGVDDFDAPRFMTVRFGNVLGSSGSIVPLFERQLREGKPLTVTHPEIERYFMTVREAVHLILQSSSNAIEHRTPRGSVFVLDMGKPVKILDLARRMISLYGLVPDVDVPIQFVGLRPGEKLFEELFDTCEKQSESRISGIFEARSSPIPLPLITRAIDLLGKAAMNGDRSEACRLTHHIVRLPGHISQGNVILAVQGGLHRIVTSQMVN